jgi:hypothetical protein
VRKRGLALLFGLPLLIGAGGVLWAIIFRRRHAQKYMQAHPAE